MAWHPERSAVALVHRALDGGVGHFDTASFYCEGEAERRLGLALRGRPDVFVSTKTAPRFENAGRPISAYTDRVMREQVETSLRRLGRERVDLLYLHGPSRAELEWAVGPLHRLQTEGKVGLIGVCGAGKPLAAAVETGAYDVIMGVFNIIHREHAPVFETAKRNGMGVVAIAPLAQGLYARDFWRLRSLADGWRIARALARNREELRQAGRLRARLSAIPGWSAPAAALGYVLANPSVDVAVTTTTKLAHLDESLEAAARTLSSEWVAALS